MAERLLIRQLHPPHWVCLEFSEPERCQKCGGWYLVLWRLGTEIQVCNDCAQGLIHDEGENAGSVD